MVGSKGDGRDAKIIGRCATHCDSDGGFCAPVINPRTFEWLLKGGGWRMAYPFAR
jgi:hypothetical protein